MAGIGGPANAQTGEQTGVQSFGGQAQNPMAPMVTRPAFSDAMFSEYNTPEIRQRPQTMEAQAAAMIAAQRRAEMMKRGTLGPGEIEIGSNATGTGRVVTAQNPKPAVVDMPNTSEEHDIADAIAIATQAKGSPLSRAEMAAARLKAHKAWTEAGRAPTAAQLDFGSLADVTPQAIDLAALHYRKTGTMPALGMGDRTTRKAIMNRAAALLPADIMRIEAGGGDIATNKAQFAADKDSLTKLTTQRAAINAFEQTAQKNIDMFLDTAGKIVDTGSPLANTAVRFVTGKLIGSPDQAAYDAARQVAVNEVAKITGNPTLAGQLSDTARKEVAAFNPSNATLKQSVAVMRLLKRDMANRITSLDTELEHIRGRLSPGATNSQVPADVVGVLKGAGPGRHTLSDGSVWMVGADGRVTKAQ